MPSISRPMTDAFGRVTGYTDSLASVRPAAWRDTASFAYIGPDGLYRDSKSGELYTGPVLGNYGAVLGQATNGKFSTQAAPVTTAPDLSVTHTVRQPAIAALSDTLTNQAQTQAVASNKAVEADMPAWRQLATDSYNRSQAALDTGRIESQLNQSMTAQETAQRRNVADQEQRNRDLAKETDSLLSRLSAENANWEAKTSAIGERAGAAAVTNANLIPLMRNPELATARSGAQPTRVAVALANALLPTQQAISARRYAQVAQIEQPWRRDVYAQDTALNSFKSALEGSLGSNWRANYQYIQSLKQQAAQMDQVNAERFIAQQLALRRFPAELLSGQISMASLLQRLDDAATEHLVNENVDTRQFAGGPVFVPPVTSPNSNRGWREPQVLPREVGGGGGGGGGQQRHWYDQMMVDRYNQLGYGQEYGPTPTRITTPALPGTGGGRLNDTWLGTDAWRNNIVETTDAYGNQVVVNPEFVEPNIWNP